ncbi:MAG: hypothetical protein HWN68_19775 [Desulfobacterales bacterium]|nr:hypothetical protein [Desulfobacterales bacterium]
MPWYDSDLLCFMISVFMGLVFCFSVIGVGVALENEEYRGYCWFPLMLTVLSSIVLTASIVRLVPRIVKRCIDKLFPQTKLFLSGR